MSKKHNRPNKRSMICDETIVAIERWKLVLADVSKKSEEVGARVTRAFRQFVDSELANLDELARLGANPAIIIQIAYADLWFHQSALEEQERRSREERHLVSAAFWKKQRVRLTQAEETLREFTSTNLYHTTSQFMPESPPLTALQRVVLQMWGASQSIADAIHVIDELELTKGEWEITAEFSGPDLVRTQKKGRKKSGPHRRDEWTSAAAEITTYLQARTGQPHHRRVCLLLKAAGVDAFGGGGIGDVDRLRKAVERFLSDENHLYTVQARLTDYEQVYEHDRPRMRYGDVFTVLVPIVEVGKTRAKSSGREELGK